MDINMIAYNNFSSHFTANATYCKPICPPSGPNVYDNTSNWRKQLGDERGVPVQYELISLPQLISSQLKKKAFPIHMHDLVTFANDNLVDFLNNYYCDLVPQCRVASSIPFWASTTLPHMNSPRSRFAYGSLAGQLFTVGGHSGKNTVENTVEAYDMKRNIWQTMAALKIPLMAATGSVIGNSLIVVGGCRNCSESLNSVYAFSTKSYSWTDLPSMSKPRQLHASVVINQSIYIIGGYSGVAKGNVAFNDSEIYSMSSNKWTPLGFYLSIPRYAAVAVAIGNNIYLIGGIQQNGLVSDAVECISINNNK